MGMSEDEDSEIYMNGKFSRTQSKRLRDFNSLRQRITEQIGIGQISHPNRSLELQAKKPNLTRRFSMCQIGAVWSFRSDCTRLRHRRMSWLVLKR